LNNQLHDKHQIINIKKHHIIVEKYKQYKLAKSAEMQLLFLLNSFVSVLKWSVKTFQCKKKACKFVSINYKMMQKHYNRKHDWKHNTDNSKHWRNVHMQTFFVNHNLFCYFVVHMSELNNDNSQLRIKTEIRINNISKISQKNLTNATMIQHE